MPIACISFSSDPERANRGRSGSSNGARSRRSWGGLGGIEQALDIANRAVGFDAAAHRAPGDARGVEKIDLGIYDYQSGALVHDHVARRQHGLGRIGVGIAVVVGVCGFRGERAGRGQRRGTNADALGGQEAASVDAMGTGLGIVGRVV